MFFFLAIVLSLGFYQMAQLCLKLGKHELIRRSLLDILLMTSWSTIVLGHIAPLLTLTESRRDPLNQVSTLEYFVPKLFDP